MDVISGILPALMLAAIILGISVVLRTLKNIEKKIEELRSEVDKSKIYFCDLCGSPTNDYLRRWGSIPSSVCNKCHDHYLSVDERKRLCASRCGHGEPKEDPVRRKEWFTNKSPSIVTQATFIQ